MFQKKNLNHWNIFFSRSRSEQFEKQNTIFTLNYTLIPLTFLFYFYSTEYCSTKKVFCHIFWIHGSKPRDQKQSAKVFMNRKKLRQFFLK